jgi:magnesium transporter
VTALLVGAGGKVVEAVQRSDIEGHLSSGELFWLDLSAPSSDELGWLGEVFGFHPLAVEDAEHFSQRPKLEEYDGYVFLVMYGAGGSVGKLNEVHCFLSEHYVVTVHRDECSTLADMARRLGEGQVAKLSAARLFHKIADGIIDSFFPVLSDLDDSIDALQDRVIRRPTDQQLSQLLQYKSGLVDLRRVIAPMRDMFAGLAGGVDELPGFDDEAMRYFRDAYDHLIRLSDLVDSYRDLLSGTTDAYLSVVSNRLNAVMKQLTIIATVFLPLSYLTGFFGQNFGWLVQHLGGLAVFVGVGIGTELVAAGGLVWLFYRRGWLSSS